MNSNNNEKLYDALLHIHTVEHKGFSNSIHYHRYEPTPYHALEMLVEQVEIKEKDKIVDFGCGKGRLNFFLNDKYGVSVLGIEMNEKLYKEANENLQRYSKKNRRKSEKISFVCCLAQQYEIEKEENKFYFFNPFSVQVFMNVIQNIVRSVEKAPRQITIILYYPSHDYIDFLENHPLFTLKNEIKLPEYHRNQNERFLIYENQ